MTKEQALEKKLEQTKWQFPNHVVFKHKGKIFHFDPNNANEESIFTQTGLEVFKEKEGNTALFDPEYFKVTYDRYLVYKGVMTERIPQPINLKSYDYLFMWCKCETIDLSDWDFSKVTSMSGFFGHTKARSVDFGNANLSMCKDFYECFCGCDGLQELLIGDYKMPPEANVVDMFSNCDKLILEYNKSAEELADIFKSGQWNTLQPVKKSKLCKLLEAFK